MNKLAATVALLLGLSLGACGVDTSTHLTPVGDAAWSDLVTSVVQEWNTALGEDCPFPFTVGANGMPVRTFTKETWQHPKEAGLYTPGVYGEGLKIDILGRSRGTLMHELGHAIGLEHNDDKTSLMYYADVGVETASTQDVKNTREALGCPAL